MRRSFLLAALVIASAMPALAGKLISTGGEFDLYKSQSKGEAVAKGGASEVFVEVSRKGGMVQVRNASGKEYWAEANKLAAYSEKSGQTMDLGQGKIDGYLDNPQAVYILQEDNNGLGGISLERDFKDAIQGNMDRETVEYRNGENN